MTIVDKGLTSATPAAAIKTSANEKSLLYLELPLPLCLSWPDLSKLSCCVMPTRFEQISMPVLSPLLKRANSPKRRSSKYWLERPK